MARGVETRDARSAGRPEFLLTRTSAMPGRRFRQWCEHDLPSDIQRRVGGCRARALAAGDPDAPARTLRQRRIVQGSRAPRQRRPAWCFRHRSAPRRARDRKLPPTSRRTHSPPYWADRDRDQHHVSVRELGGPVLAPRVMRDAVDRAASKRAPEVRLRASDADDFGCRPHRPRAMASAQELPIRPAPTTTSLAMCTSGMFRRV